MLVEMHGGPFEGPMDFEEKDFPSEVCYHIVWSKDEDSLYGDGAVYEVMDQAGYFIGFHRELWPDHPRRLEQYP